jgi:two-component system nitrogen regulation response regulator GlnG
MTSGKGGRGSQLMVETLESPDEGGSGEEERVPHLTILHHASLARIGDEALIAELDRGGPIAISRTEPTFARVDGTDPWPIGDPFVSRKPVLVRSLAKGEKIEIAPSEASVQIAVDGVPLKSAAVFPMDRLDRGLVLELSGRAIVLLHRRTARGDPLPHFGLIGASDAVDEIRRQIVRVADLKVPVLIRGETGCGKELVANALHGASPRRVAPFEAVNMGVLGREMAAAELFGHVKGAFTGAIADNPGYFVRANGGTLFLDEIAEAPPDVQVMLLRALETDSVQPIGQRGATPIDVRIIAATDADLDRAVADGRFRSALFHRLCSFEIRIAPLRERRDDLGRLVVHFIARISDELGEARRDEGEAVPRPWFPASIARRLYAHDWPGNVRELRNAMRQLLIGSRGRSELQDVALGFESPASSPAIAPPSRAAATSESEPTRRPAEVREDELLDALERHQWRISAAAKALGIKPSSLHMLIDKSPNIKKATTLSKEEIERARNEVGTDTDTLARHLRVSAHGLRLRLRALGL